MIFRTFAAAAVAVGMGMSSSAAVAQQQSTQSSATTPTTAAPAHSQGAYGQPYSGYGGYAYPYYGYGAPYAGYACPYYGYGAPIGAPTATMAGVRGDGVVGGPRRLDALELVVNATTRQGRVKSNGGRELLSVELAIRSIA